MSEEKQTVFRKETMERISSVDQLTDYLRVTDPGIWVILAALIALLSGLFVWSLIGNLETRQDVMIFVKDHRAQIITSGMDPLEAGMPLSVSGQDFHIAAAQTDEYGRPYGIAEVTLPDGTYEGTVVTDSVHPISFLLGGK
ncbi:MAG: hypothetical protein IKG55_00890 [Solobacterium sp.]|nr:hypothetical protein [Solobacterium sp.]